MLYSFFSFFGLNDIRFMVLTFFPAHRVTDYPCILCIITALNICLKTDLILTIVFHDTFFGMEIFL